jgi:hypothetical protein
MRGLHRLFDYSNQVGAQLVQIDFLAERHAEGGQRFLRIIPASVYGKSICYTCSCSTNLPQPIPVNKVSEPR